MVTDKAQQAEQDRLAQDFVEFAEASGVLRFGEFKTKAGRMSPYFFNAGLFDDGAKMGRLAEFYAKALLASGIEFDMVFGPAYKGIPLAATVAVELARLGRNVPFAYNRKEAKDHGEGGTLVGAPLKGRVLIVDDVMSAGTAARESIALIRAPRRTPWRLRWTGRKKPPKTARTWSTARCSTYATSWACRSAPSPPWPIYCSIWTGMEDGPARRPTANGCWRTASATVSTRPDLVPSRDLDPSNAHLLLRRLTEHGIDRSPRNSRQDAAHRIGMAARRPHRRHGRPRGGDRAVDRFSLGKRWAGRIRGLGV